MSIISSKHTAWFKSALFIAGIYHILWGISVLFFPCFWFDLCSLSHPNYIHLWQLIGGYEKNEIETRIQKVATAGKLSRFPGNVFEVL